MKIIHDDSFDLEYLLSRPLLRHAFTFSISFLFGFLVAAATIDYSPVSLIKIVNGVWFGAGYAFIVFIRYQALKKP